MSNTNETAKTDDLAIPGFLSRKDQKKNGYTVDTPLSNIPSTPAAKPSKAVEMGPVTKSEHSLKISELKGGAALKEKISEAKAGEPKESVTLADIGKTKAGKANAESWNKIPSVKKAGEKAEKAKATPKPKAPAKPKGKAVTAGKPKAKATTKAAPKAKGTATSKPKAKAPASGPAKVNKRDEMVALLKRPNGASLGEMLKANPLSGKTPLATISAKVSVLRRDFVIERVGTGKDADRRYKIVK